MNGAATLLMWLIPICSVGVQAQQAVSPATPVVKNGERQSTVQENRSGVAVGDEVRSAIIFTAYDLTVHLNPSNRKMSVLARVTVRNEGSEPLSQIALQISSLLRWDAASQVVSGRPEKLVFDQHLLQTNADRSGMASEALFSLPKMLKSHDSAELTLFYSGSTPSAVTKEAATSSTSGSVDSDQDATGGVLVRGFGDLLWTAISSPQVFAGEGASLMQTAGLQRLRQAAATVRLRLAVEYKGDAPAVAFFCGREQPLRPSSDDPELPVDVNQGVATAEWPVTRLGFHSMSLMVVEGPIAPGDGVVSVTGGDAAVSGRISTLAAPVAQLLTEWLGVPSARTLTVVERVGEPFSEGSLLVAPIVGADADDATLNALLVPALVHARFRSEQVWLDEGMAEFLSLVWLERTQGRAAALQALQDEFHALALAESVAHPEATGDRGLLAASDAVYYRTKAGVVLWQLRQIVGDEALKLAFQRYARTPRLVADPMGFETLLEQVYGKSLRWFFDDWVYHDRGLPELSIESVAPREVQHQGSEGGGWLVVVEVRNDGGAVAEVPVTVRAGALTTTERLRVNARSVASTRVLFQGVPEQVQVNDGTVPESIESMHTQNVAVR